MWPKVNLVFFVIFFVVIESNNAVKAQIVQPNTVKDKHLIDDLDKVNINPIKLKETDNIRKEIKSAVSGNKLFVKSEYSLGESLKNGKTILTSARNVENANDKSNSNISSQPNEATESDPLLIPGNPKDFNNIGGENNLNQDSVKTVLKDTTPGNSSLYDFSNASNEENKKSSQNQTIDENESNVVKGSLTKITSLMKVENEMRAPMKNESDSNLKEGGVVQPDWTQVDSNQENSSTDVIVTEQEIQETAEIREDIKEAIKEHAHVIGQPNDDEIVQEIDEYYHHRSRLKQFISNVLEADIEDSADNVEDEEREKVEPPKIVSIKPNSTNESPEIIPNVVNSQIIKEMSQEKNELNFSRYSFTHFDDSRPLRSEVLSLKSIEEDLSFPFGIGVTQWKIIENQRKTVLVGIMGSNLISLIKNNSGDFQQLLEILQLNAPILDIEIYSQWISTSKMSEEIAIVAFATEIICIKLNNQQIIANWNIGPYITGMKYYTVENKHFLVILTSPLSDIGTPSINIYQFDLITNDFWISQVIPLKFPCFEITFLDTGRDIVLAIIQMNSTIVFTYNPNMQNKAHFQHVYTVESEGVQSISGFQMGGFSYLAIGGVNPKILRYHRGKFFPQTIFGQTFQFVERFIPIPARTYRDDLILLVQHKITYDTHSLTVIETLIWDGQSFQSTPSIPCIIGNYTFQYGTSCLIDIDREDGIKGAAVMHSATNNSISLIIPRLHGPSGLFHISTELVEKNIEDDLDQIYSYLNIMVEEQTAIIDKAQKYIEKMEKILKSESRLIVDTLQTPEFDFDGVIDEIIINGEKWNEEEDISINTTTLLDLLEETEKEIRLLEKNSLPDKTGNNENNPQVNFQRKKREVSQKDLEVESILAENLFVAQINGIPVEEIFYIKDNEINFNGTVIIQGNLEVKKSISSSPQQGRDSLPDNSVEIETVNLDGDLSFERINGIPWSEIISGVVLVNIPDDFSELTVNGEVIVENGLFVTTLNDLQFPDEYLLSSGPESSVVKAKKRFHNTLTSSVIEVGEGINGVHPNDVITLSDNQRILGTTTFTDLEVTGTLEILGSISGQGLDDFLPNPNLLHTNIIESNCEFNQLEVQGPVIISSLSNGENLDTILDDIIYETDENVLISSKKIFKVATFEKGIHLEEEIINEIHLDEFVTANTVQELNISTITGDIFFNFLELTGFFDSVNITELNENSVKLYGEQNTNVELIFEDSRYIETKSLEVLKYLNHELVDNFRTIFDNFVIDNARFETFSVLDSLTTMCDVTGSKYLNNIDLEEFNENRMSLTLDQIIISNMTLDELIIENHVEVKALNGLPTNLLINLLEKFENLPIMIQTGKVMVDGLEVLGNVKVNNLNGLKFNEEIQDRAIWLNRPNFIRNNLKFLDPIVIDGDLNIEGYVNSEHFQSFLDDIIFKTDDEIIIFGPKKFMAPVNVVEKTTISKINGIPASEIVTKSNVKFKGSVRVKGDLIVNNLQIAHSFNDYDVDELLDWVKYDEEMGTFIFTKEIIFRGHQIIEDLYVHGSINDYGNVEDFMENLLFKNMSAMITGRKIFQNEINFQNAIYIETLNGLNLTEFFDSIVYINQFGEIKIETPVIFQEPVVAKSTNVYGQLHTSNLMGCDIYEWNVNGLRTDLPEDIQVKINFAPGTLDTNSLNVLYANGELMANVISLHTPQNISGDIYLSEVYLESTLEIGDKINGIDLILERDNTLMINGNQHITSPIAMQSARVLGNLQILTSVNEKELNNLATLKSGDIYLRSPMSFKDVRVKNVLTSDEISGLNFSRWYHNSLWRNNRDNQIVLGNWTTQSINIEENIEGNGMINDIPVENIISQGDDHHNSELDSYLKDIQVEQERLCHKAKDLIKWTQTRVYFLKYFDRSFKIIEDGPVNRLMFFTDSNETYLLINIFCYTNIYRWHQGWFEKINGMETGTIQEVLAIPALSEVGGVYIVTNSVKNNEYDCNISGTNIWHFSSQHLTLVERSGNIWDYALIHYFPEHNRKFFGIDEKNNLLVEVDLISKRERSWNLTNNANKDYRFLPFNAELGIALSDGEHLLIVNNKDSSVRRRRQRRFLMTKTIEFPIVDTSEERVKRNDIDESSFVLRPFDAKKKEINRKQLNAKDNAKFIDRTKEVLYNLMSGFNESSSSNFKNEDYKIIIAQFQDELNDMIHNNISLKRLSWNSTFPSFDYINFHVSDFITAEKLLRALVQIKEIHREYNNYNKKNSTTEPIEDDIVGNASPIGFDSILNILVSGFIDLFNIWLKRRDDIVGTPLKTANNISLENADLIINQQIRSIIIDQLNNELKNLDGNLERSKINNDLFDFGLKKIEEKLNSEADVQSINPSPVMNNNQTKNIGISSEGTQFIDNNTTIRDSYNNATAQSSNSELLLDNVLNDLTKVLVDLVGNLNQKIDTNDDSELKLTDADRKHISAKVNEIISDLQVKNISSKESSQNRTSLLSKDIEQIIISGDSIRKSDWNKVEKFLNAILLVNQIQDHSEQQIADQKNFTKSGRSEMNGAEFLGSPGPIDFKSILTILASGFYNSLNMILRRRDNLLGTSQRQHNNMSLENTVDDIDKQTISTVIQDLEDKLKALNELLNFSDKNHRINEEEDDENLKKYNENLNSDINVTHDHRHTIDSIVDSDNTNISSVLDDFIIKNNTSSVNSTQQFIEETNRLRTTPPTTSDLSEYLNEPIIANEISNPGLLVAYNTYLPGKSTGEVLALKVGSRENRKNLIAVTQSKEHIVAGQHDCVKLYYDIEQGHLFQSISTFRPRSLTVLHIRDETVLAFIEDKNLIRIFVYRGIEGFVEFMKFRNDQYVTILTSASLPGSDDVDNKYERCWRHFLIAATAGNKIEFYEAQMAGTCGLDIKLNCDRY